MLDPKVLVALDYQHEADAFAFIERISPAQCRLKVGKEMFTLFGPQFVRQLVAKAVAASAELGVWMVNVHASGGERMMRAAKEALLPYGDKAPLLIGVTVLTSMEQADMAPLGLTVGPAEQVTRLASVAREEGDYLGEQFMQWFLKEQVEEVASMTTLLTIADRAGANLFDLEDFVSREMSTVGDTTGAPSAAGGTI